MKVLVCGGRGYGDSGRVFRELDKLHAAYHFSQLIEGGCKGGADRHAKSWAISRRVIGREFRANWKKYGLAAGPIRNQRMLDVGEPDLVVAFPGGNGTADMVQRAKDAGVKVLEIAS
jgi:hypothetical protein